MTADQRVNALMDFRFTERQAWFLALVMRHAGVCVPRQYASFACIAHGGAKCNAFFARLVRRRYAIKPDCVHNECLAGDIPCHINLQELHDGGTGRRLLRAAGGPR